MNGEVCCLLGVCCPPRSAKQLNAFVNEFAHDREADATAVDEATVREVGAWVLRNFDLAPAGSLSDLKGQIADLVRKHPK